MNLQPHEITVPKNGTEKYDITVPAEKMYRVVYGHVSLTTDATVANRYVRVGVIAPDGRNVLCLCSGAAVTASKTNQRHSYMQGIYRETSFINNVIQVPLAEEMYLPAGYKLRTFVDDGVAGDEFTAEWMIEELTGY